MIANEEEHSAKVVRELTQSQSALYAYIYSLVGNASSAADVLQEANLVLWDKRGQYDATRPFLPWAFKVAYFQVLAYRKRCQRDRLVLDDEMLAIVAGVEEDGEVESAIDLEVLETCLQRLTARARELIAQRYVAGKSLDALADEGSRRPNAVAAELYRIRKVLMECVQSRVKGQMT